MERFMWAVLAICACGKPEVAFDTLETARTQARENASFNANRFRQTDPRVKGLEFIARGDSTQSPECPQGDGWASIDFVLPDGRFLKAKCSTVSSAVGCMPDDEFKTKPYASEDGQCAPLTKVPFPFRKIAQ
jgi:hypothetical protein